MKINDSTVYGATGETATYKLSDLWKLIVPDTCDVYDTTYITVQDTLMFSINTNSVSQPDLVGMKVYPNPAGSQLTIAIADFSKMSSYTLKIVNTLGAEVYSQSVSSATYTINTTSLGGAGTYFLEVYDASNGKRGRKVIVIQ
jgi:hypothetical protein